MGGGTCAAFTCRYPDRVIALAVCDSLAAIRLPEPYATQLTDLNAATRDFSQAQRVLGKTTLASDPERTLLYLQIASFNSVTLKTVKGSPVPWTPSELGKTGVPVLYIVGEEDVICSPSLVRASHELTPGSAYAELKSAGHSAYFETPAAFNDVLLEFLSAHPAA
jgi:pimeloyl-ACP methyl ester carboxylesterase